MKARLLPTAVRCRWELHERKKSRMEEYIAFDSHKRYTWVEREDATTGRAVHDRLRHAPGAVRRYLQPCARGTP